MSGLDADYAGAGFARRLGWGERPALLLVDPVLAYLSPGSPLFCATAAAALTAMTSLLGAARAGGRPVAFTAVGFADETCAEAPLFATKVPGLRVFADGSPLAALPPELAPAPGDLVVRKHHASAFAGTALAAWLTARRADTVVVGGYSTSGCVRASAVDALQHGFRPMVVREACADRAPGPHEANLFDLDAKYADVVDMSEALRRLE
ncbi:isochorismatase family protein [Dactylosporangium aurantiacum]|uniref:Isochorismatase family protein n=1 Tax=Dactylosporangium aurantiacum TaxID=35754 RepID=A0A9Q9I8Q8_9ACTN|nr:isochorismatase family protein [Dactylosporangium aurantiacum]MDG6103660.1 isochorismatase family protein [Dactylosporangium aurantiacum]UWZ51854.1 isochorismatase family protein [Dactylosporangium aurantiacum]